MIHCQGTKILVCTEERALFDLVEDSDVFIWGQATLNHFFLRVFIVIDFCYYC